jgi:hypothetical protein
LSISASALSITERASLITASSRTSVIAPPPHGAPGAACDERIAVGRARWPSYR